MKLCQFSEGASGGQREVGGEAGGRKRQVAGWDGDRLLAVNRHKIESKSRDRPNRIGQGIVKEPWKRLALLESTLVDKTQQESRRRLQRRFFWLLWLGPRHRGI